ncbi:hypothetical protein LXL04_035935 [Taraxacum kok-saghyz]
MCLMKVLNEYVQVVLDFTVAVNMEVRKLNIIRLKPLSYKGADIFVLTFSLTFLKRVFATSKFDGVAGFSSLSQRPDIWSWELDPSGDFTVRSSQKYLDGLRLPCRVNLVMRGVDVDSVLCPMCQEEEESVSHLLVGCITAWQVWHSGALWIQMAIPQFESRSDMVNWVDSHLLARLRAPPSFSISISLSATTPPLHRLYSDTPVSATCQSPPALVPGSVSYTRESPLHRLVFLYSSSKFSSFAPLRLRDHESSSSTPPLLYQASISVPVLSLRRFLHCSHVRFLYRSIFFHYFFMNLLPDVDCFRLLDLLYHFASNLLQFLSITCSQNMEVLLAGEIHAAQERIVDCDQDEVDPEPQEETNGDDLGTNEPESEEEVLEEVEYKSDGVQIIEHCGD